MKITFNKTIVFHLLFLGIFILAPFSTIHSQSNSALHKVEAILFNQADKWNKGEIDAFMEDYWKSPDLQFVGSRGVTFGWEQTLQNYKKGYPDKQAMGQLRFEIIRSDQLSRKVILMSGKFMLDRTGLENLEGHFLLVWKKIKGKWVIIADHTS